jgi:hypothetical protein
MPANNRQIRIADFLRLASQEKKPFDQRLRNLDSLVGIRGGLGKQTKRAVRAILDLIRVQTNAQCEQKQISEETRRSIEDRIEFIDDRLSETTYNRRVRLQRSRAEKELFEQKIAVITANGHPKPPAPALPGFKWRYKISPTGDIKWQMFQISKNSDGVG